MPSFDLTLEPAFTPTLNLQGEGGTLVLELATILRGEKGDKGDRGADGASTAAAVAFTPAGNLASTNVQAALQELDSEKLNLTGGTLTGLLNIAAGVITAFAPAMSVAQTWNNAAVAFVGKTNDFTDTASAAGSLLERWRVGGSDVLSIQKDGSLILAQSVAHVGGGTNPAKLVLVPGFGPGTGLRIGVYNYPATVGNTAVAAFFYSNATGPTLGFHSSGAFGFGSESYLGSELDAVFRRDAANTLAQRNGTNAQTFRLYNTYTDASNYERGFMRWASNVLEIGTEAAGTGANRNVKIKAGLQEILFKTNAALVLPSTIENTSYTMIPVTGGIKWLNGSYSAGIHMTMCEMTAPAAPATNEVAIYAEDNGAGKTRLMARFATGAAVQIAIEP